MMDPFILFVPSDYSIFNNKPYRFNYIMDVEDTRMSDLVISYNDRNRNFIIVTP